MNDIEIIFKNSNSNRLPVSLVVESLPYPTQVAEGIIQTEIKNKTIVLDGSYLQIPEPDKTAEIKKAFIFLRQNEKKLDLLSLMKKINEFHEKFELKYFIFDYNTRCKAIDEFAYNTPNSQERKCLNKILQS